MKSKIVLCFLNLTLISCGKSIEMISGDRIHVWGPEYMTCQIVSYPVWQKICDSQHISCTTHASGNTDCIIHMSGRELERKIDEE